MLKPLVILIFFLTLQTIEAQERPHPKVYTCYLADSIVIDGLLNEASWSDASWSDSFLDIEGPEKSVPFENTRVKMLWDKQYLYIAAVIETQHIWSTITANESIIYRDDDFEVFIDPDGDATQYAELEFNAYGAMMDIFLNKPYRCGGEAMFGWDCKGLEYAISYRGSLNNPADQDTSWTIEMALPLQAIVDLPGIRKKPVNGDFWRINFSRVDWDFEISNNQYKKVEGKAERNWVWTPQWAINMHKPEFWGYLVFIEEHTGTQIRRTFRDPYWNEKQLLFAMFEKQQDYARKTGHYCRDTRVLLPTEQDKKYQIEINVVQNQFIIKLTNQGKSFYINNEGRLWTN